MADADPQRDLRTAAPSPIVTAPPASRRTWRRPLLIASVPALIAGVGGYFYVTGGRTVSTDNAYVQQDRVSVSSDVNGRIVEVDARENQAVTAGAVLFRIDPAPYHIAVQRRRRSPRRRSASPRCAPTRQAPPRTSRPRTMRSPTRRRITTANRR